jgi:hypothetical protein
MSVDSRRNRDRNDRHLQLAEPGIFDAILKHSLHNFCERTAEHLGDLVCTSEGERLYPALDFRELCWTHSDPLTEPRLRQSGIFT